MVLIVESGESAITLIVPVRFSAGDLFVAWFGYLKGVTSAQVLSSLSDAMRLSKESFLPNMGNWGTTVDVCLLTSCSGVPRASLMLCMKRQYGP